MDLRTSFETKVMAAFAAAVLVVVALAVTTWKVSRDALEAALQMSHTQEVLNKLAEAKGTTLLIESITRGYVISGNAGPLAEGDAVMLARETSLRRIKELTADNARQQARWMRLREAVNERIALSKRSVQLRETEGFEAARTHSASAPVRETRERYLKVLREMEEEERRLLDERSAEQLRAQEITVATGALAALVLVILLCATYFVIRRQIRATEASRQELAESEQNLFITLHSIGDAVLATDTEGRITRMNPVAERLTGWSFASAQGQPVDEVFRIVHEQTRAPAVVPVAKVLASGEIQGLANHIVLISRDGSEWPIADSAAPICDASGRVNGVVLVFRDVTTERQAQRTIREQNELLEQRIDERTALLRASEERLNFALHKSHTGGWELDLVDHTAHRSLEHDRIFGYDALLPLWTYEMFLQHVLPEDRAETNRRFSEATAAQSDWGFECRIRRADGEVRWIFAAGEHQPDAAGQTRRMAGIVQDITERKRAEQEVRDLNASLERRVAERTLQLQEASRAKSDFLANMSHELRTPLNSIIGCSEMLKDGVLGKLDAKQCSFVTDIFDAGSHLLSLINDILDLSKVEAGMLQLETDAVDVVALLKASTLIVREKALAHRIRLDTNLDPALGTMLTDERKLKQIVYNLLSNAVKFTPAGGAVTLCARRCARSEVALDEAMPGRFIALAPGEDIEFLAITIKDTGVGIAEQDLPKLFEPFTQVDSSAARRQGGTGLGLSLVRRLAELHGGTVGVASRPGAGSSFCVWLPYREAAPAMQEGKAAPESTALSLPAVPLALVIEDDDRIAELIATQLRAEGFEVIRAATAEEGLVRAAKCRPQLITLDIFLPAMDGWEFMRRLKADPKLADTPVVIITLSEDMARGIALGARRVLHKPFVRAELIATLAGLVDVQPNGAPARVLLVEDNVKAVELLATMLESEGYRVLRAYGGAEAIEVAHRTRPDLVILDLMMPEVSGFEVVRALRDSEQTARIPILVLTAKDLSAEDRARLNDDVSAILAKANFSRTELLAELRRALPKHAQD